jgi:hypothetical protein
MILASPREELQMDPTTPVSRELQILMPVIAETMKFAVQVINQTRAIAEVLIEKGVLSQAELDVAIKKAPPVAEKLNGGSERADKETELISCI